MVHTRFPHIKADSGLGESTRAPAESLTLANHYKHCRETFNPWAKIQKGRLILLVGKA